MKFKPFSLNLFCFIVLLVVSLLPLNYALKTHLYFSQDDFMSIAYLNHKSYVAVASDFLQTGDLIAPKRMIGYLLGYLNFKLLFDLFATNPLPFILNNQILHLLNVFLLFYLALKLTNNRWGALLISLIFSKYYLYYFTNSHEYLVTLFSLLSFVLFFKYPRKTFLALISFILALLSKQYAYVVPLFLLYYSYSYRRDLLKNNRPFLLVLFLYCLLQFLYYLNTSAIVINPTYQTTLNPATLFGNLTFYFKPQYLLILALFPLFSKKYHTWFLLLFFLLSLFPALVLVNRHDLYYFYFPAVFLLLFVAVNLPRTLLKQIPAFLLVIFLFGGRQAFPVVARQDYPNWDLVSINNLLSTVKQELQSNPESVSIKMQGLNLYRDARSILDYNVLPLFLGRPHNQLYNFSYDSSKMILTINKLPLD